MRYCILALSCFLLSAPAYAQVAGEPCSTFGQTVVSDDKNSIFACLRPTLGDPASPLAWVLNTVAPKVWQPDGAGSDDFYAIGPEQKAR